MTFIDSITPKNTNEVKSGLFIQKKYGNYRQVYPAAWNDKIIWKNFLFGGKPVRAIFMLLLIAFLYFGYVHDYQVLVGFYEKVMSDPIGFCNNITVVSNPQTLGDIEVNLNGYANTLQGDFKTTG